MSPYETVERVRASVRSARPNPAENPAWANCHLDCKVLLAEIDRLTSGPIVSAEQMRIVIEQRDEAIEARNLWEARAIALFWAEPLEDATVSEIRRATDQYQEWKRVQGK